MNDIEKIIRINAFIQRKMGVLYFDGKEVYAVALDHSVSFAGFGEDEKLLSDDQLEELFGQTFGKPAAHPPLDSKGIKKGDLVHIVADGIIESISESGYMVRVHGEVIPMGKEQVSKMEQER